MREVLVTRSNDDGTIKVAVVRRGFAVSATVGIAGESRQATIDRATAGLPEHVGDDQIPARDWLPVVAKDRRLTPMAIRVAIIIATARPGQWLGLEALGEMLAVSPKNVPRAIGALTRAGYVTRSQDGTKAFYRMTLP